MTGPARPRPTDGDALLKGVREAIAGIAEFLDQVAHAATAFIDALASALRPRPKAMSALQLARARHQVGGNLTDALTEPGLWCSVDCSAWLHASCAAAHLGCTCCCHRIPAETPAARAADGRWPVLS